MLQIKPESLTTIVGTVGSGKSTLLLAILREIVPTSGHLAVRGRVAYAAQDPWLFEASVSILFFAICVPTTLLFFKVS